MNLSLASRVHDPFSLAEKNKTMQWKKGGTSKIVHSDADLPGRVKGGQLGGG
jgi:hypothetical protein